MRMLKFIVNILPGVGLCPKTPQNMAGRRIDPAISEHIPNIEAPELIKAAWKQRLNICVNPLVTSKSE